MILSPLALGNHTYSIFLVNRPFAIDTEIEGQTCYKIGYTCATKSNFGARHYKKPSTGYSDIENILLAGAYIAFLEIHADIKSGQQILPAGNCHRKLNNQKLSTIPVHHDGQPDLIWQAIHALNPDRYHFLAA